LDRVAARQTFRAWLVIAVGLAIASYGLRFYWKALKEAFSEDFEGRSNDWLHAIGIVGHIARGLLFNLIGLFLITAGWQSDPSEAGGLRSALTSLQQTPYGWILLGLAAAGLAAYGVFNLARAFYGRIHMPSETVAT